jgi:hypothetical protein
VYREPLSNKLRVGLVLLNKQQFISEQLKRQGLRINEIDQLFQNKNNVFVAPLSLEDNSLILNMSALNIGNKTISDTLAEQLNNMHLKDSSVVAPVQLMERFREELGQNQSMLKNIMYPERDENIKIEPVLNANIVGPMYYVNVSSKLGEFTEYNPNKSQYLVKFKRSLKFKPSMLKIDQMDKRYAYVKKGPFSNKRLRIKAYNEAHLKITLATNGRQLESHVIKMTDKQGKPILNIHGHQQFKVSPIYPSHLFYFDLHLKNDKDAQVVKIIDDNNIKIIEKGTIANVFSEREITFDDVKYEHPGFRIITGDDSTGYKQFIPYFVSDDESSDEVYDNEDEEQEMDYGDEQQEGELYTESPREQEFKDSFKDSERTSSEEISISRVQNQLKTQIEKILNIFKINEKAIDIYSAINSIETIINKIKERLVSYKKNILLTSDSKFIILLVVLYFLDKNNIPIPSIDTYLTLLFAGKDNYFNNNDLRRDEIAESIFLNDNWKNELTTEEMSESKKAVETLLKSKSRKEDIQLKRNINIIKLILINADKTIQRINNTQYKISSNIQDIGETLIPISKRRVREEPEESEESVFKKARRAKLFGKTTASSQFITIKDLLADNIPSKEVKIIWGKGVYLDLLNHVKNMIQDKYNETQNPNYLYIKENLYRAPFAIKNDNITPSVKKIFTYIYKNSILAPLQNIKHERRLE